MNKRLNITLPVETVRLMDRVAGRGRRSSLIDRAVRRYVKEETRANVRKQLAASYKANAELDLQLADDWFPLEEQTSDLGGR
jgi:metal-responsive CopG/Arc/MetJ family transcriptional regulator